MFVFGNVLAMPCRGLIRSGVELVNRLASVQPQCRSIRERERERANPMAPLSTQRFAPASARVVGEPIKGIKVYGQSGFSI